MPNYPRTSDEIRETYLRFFRERGHQELPGWPLVPIGDPTSLFTSAGMQQFKPYFMGEATPPGPRITTVQRCFRTTDIEEVGDYSHCTAFEMLGNFSLGDYFKKGAIEMAWELLTQHYGIPEERLHITIFLTDDEAYGYWREVGVPDERIHRRDEDLNYWFSFPKDTPGASGPCGPDSEIYYDFYPERGLEDAQLGFDASGKPVKGVGFDDDRFLEIWNLVFMQLYQSPDGTRADLPAQNIDTGSGLERVTAVLQGVRSVFETDIFLPVLQEAARVMGTEYTGGGAKEEPGYTIRAMSEHCRAAAMLVADGVVPSNEGRGYVLRRVVRRAIYLARRAGVKEYFTARLAAAAIDKLAGAYPQMAEQRDFVQAALHAEEARFVRTLASGTQRLEALLERLNNAGTTTVPGDEAFLLYDTFGMPIELTREIAAGEGFDVDDSGFEAALDAQRRRAREAGRFLKGEPSPLLQQLGEEHSAFVGYSRIDADANVIAILRGGQLADMATEGEEAEIVLDTTPFYPEGGGQVGDHGNIVTRSGVFAVEDTQSTGGAIIHRGRVREGAVRVGEAAQAEVDIAYRSGSARNHTGTHMLHAALRGLLGSHVRQQGSYVTPERLRFDFTHLEQVPREALAEVQQLVNEKVRHDLEVQWRNTSYRQAIDAGALAFFGDKYGNDVRVVEIKDDGATFSAELCGGTHVHRTGEIGFVHILRESAVAAGTRRIEALTGRGAEQYLVETQDRLQRLADRLSTTPADLEERVEALQGELERLRRQGEELQRAQGAASADALIEAATLVGGAHLVVGRVDGGSQDVLKDIADRVRARLKPSLLVIASVMDGRPSFLVAATPDLVSKGIHSGNLIREVAKAAGGGGGGRPDMATAGAKDASRLDEALGTGRRLATEALEGAAG
ncbi:MAG: alanine--tRNA ligase [Dehalococcoidia bacterium]|nr:alanine--tRNA ligase [Dehalococcoidia bacterium]